LQLDERKTLSIVDTIIKSDQPGEAGLNTPIGGLGIRLVGVVRHTLQSSTAYEQWLAERRKRVSEKFVSICRDSVESDRETKVLSFKSKYTEPTSKLASESLKKLSQQSLKLQRERLLTTKEFEESLKPSPSTTQQQDSLFKRLFKLINPFDQSTVFGDDWLSVFRSYGYALKNEMLLALQRHQDLLKSSWQPTEYIEWTSVGARLINSLSEIQKLLITAENLLLLDQGKLAGFHLSLIFSMLKGLRNERAILVYLIAHPELALKAENWNTAIDRIGGE